MSQQPVEANVTLTADTSDYNSNINQSAANTDNFGKSIDSLTGKMDRLVKTAGRKMVGFAAADLTGITAATAAYAAYERQMTSLSAQAAVLNNTMDGQKATFNGYATSVNALRASFGTTTRDAAGLVQTLTKMSDGTAPVLKLADSFTKLGNTTGESTQQLTQSMLQLQKTMGTPQRDTEKFNNQLAVLSANSNASAGSILQFAQQLAPVGRLVNTSQTDIMGLSTAFNKAGQDGYQAANVYTKMVTDIAYATQSGSPDLKLYSGLVGMTVDQFKQLSSIDQVTRVFDSINRQGPQAITTLNRMGLDGMRTVRTVTAMAQQSGGLQEALDQARNADPNALGRGNQAATGGLIDGLAKLRSELAMTGEAFGKNFAGPAGGFINMLDGLAKVAHALVGGDLGKIAGVVAGIGVAVTAVAGSLALATKGMFAFAGVNQLLRNSFTYGVKEANAPSNAFARSMGVPGLPGRVGRQIEAEGNFVNRGLYSAGQSLGARGYNPRNWMMSAAGMGLRGGAWVNRELIRPQLSAGTIGGLENVTNRWRLFNEPSMMNYRPVNWLANRGWQNGGLSQAAANVTAPVFRNAGVLASTAIMAGGLTKTSTGVPAPAPVAPNPLGTPNQPPITPAQAAVLASPNIKQPPPNPTGPAKPPPTPQQDKLNAAAGQAAAAKQQEAALKAARAMGTVEKESTGLAQGMKVAAMEMIAMGGTLTSVGAGIGKTLYGLVGNNPYIGTAVAAFAGVELLKAGTKQIGTVSAPTSTSALTPYLAAGGIQPAAAFSPIRIAQGENQTVYSASHISPTDSAAANDSSFQPTNSGLKGKTQAQALAMLAPQFKEAKRSPAALSALALDLTAAYGRGDAQKMMDKLMSGKGQDTTPLLDKAVTEPAAGSWWHKLVSGDPNYSAVSKDFSQYFKTNQDFVDEKAAGTGMNSQQDAAKERANRFGNALLHMGQEGDNQNRMVNYNQKEGYAHPNSLSSQGSDPNKLNREAFIVNLAKAQGVTMTADQAAQFKISTNAKNATEAATDFFNQIFSKDTSDKIQNAWLSSFGQNKGLTGTAATAAVMGEMSGKNMGTPDLTLDQKIGFMEGGDTFTSKVGRTALSKSANMNDQLQAVSQIVSSMTEAGKSAPDIIQAMGAIKTAAGTDKAPEYQIAAAAQTEAQRQESWKMPGMSRTQQFGAQIKDFSATFQGAIGDPNQQQIQHAAEDTLAQQAESQRQYFVGLLTQQREFNIQKHRSEVDFGVQRDRMDYQFNLSRTRANEDYGIQRDRMEYQYNLSRTRAQDDFAQQQKWSQEEFARTRNREEFDFNLQRQRATADFNRQMTRSQYDFNLSRKRQEEDYQHSVVEMTKQTAMQAADIYKRIPVQSTTSAGWLVQNANAQLKQMTQQEANLKKLRGMGMSTDAIQQLKLTDPNNAQQLQRLVGDVQNDPKLIKQFNEAIAKRLKAAGALTTDVSSDQWKEFNRQYKLSRERGAADFERQVKLSRQDFKRNMGQQETDFQRSMDRQGKDYQTGQEHSSKLFHTSMNRQATDFATTEQNMSDDFHKSMNRAQKDYNTTTDNMVTDFNKSMNRAQKDLDRSATTIDGNFTQILTQATKKLSGHARTQAQTVLSEFSGVRDTTTGVSTDLMKALAAIFGVDYKPPHIAHATQTNQSAKNHQAIGDTRAATGGVLPGFTPGQDVHHFVSPTGGTLHLSGGEAVMRPEWTKAVGGARAVAEMNAAAIKGQWFAKGGIVSRVPGAKQFAANQVGKPYTWGGVGPSGYDCSGFMSAITNFLRGQPIHQRVGATASFPWPGFLPGPGLFTIGSTKSYRGGVGHMAGTLDGLNVESRGGQGPIIGKNARGYRDPGFNTVYHLGASGDFGYGGTAGTVANPDIMAALQLLESSYPKVDKKVATMSAVHPLKGNQMSKVINRMAWRAFEKLRNTHGDKHKDHFGGLKELKAALLKMGDTGVGGGPGGAPTNVHGNAAIVKQMAADKGWTGQEWDALYKVMMDESGFRNTAQNPTSTAYGMFQFLDKTWAAYGGHKTSDARLQTKYGLNYIAKRYGDPLGALQHENQHGWYGDGQIFTGPQKVGVGERGPEMLLPLNDRGAAFIQNLMEKMLPGNAAKSHHTAGFSQPTTVHNMHNYQIDKSTTFSGPITVQANDPNMLIAQLRARARASALTNAAKGGVKVA